jgi:chromosome partitioning protein
VARVITVASQKGGTGKTASTLNLGAALAMECGQEVLLVDIDPQANLTMGVGVDPYGASPTIYDILHHHKEGITPAIRATEVEGLDLVPSTLDLAGAELELSGRFGREWLLRRALADAVGRYDFVLIDTPPSLGLFTQNALVAASEILIPLQVHVYSLKALPQLQRVVELVREQNTALHVMGIVLTMYDRRNRLTEQVETSVRSALGDLVFETVIPVNVRLAESPAVGKPVLLFAPDAPSAVAYRQLAQEVMQRG